MMKIKELKLDEAIEVLREDLGADTYDSHPYFYEAQKLGIEALKALRYMRKAEHPFPPELLPGETKE